MKPLYIGLVALASLVILYFAFRKPKNLQTTFSGSPGTGNTGTGTGTGNTGTGTGTIGHSNSVPGIGVSVNTKPGGAQIWQHEPGDFYDNLQNSLFYPPIQVGGNLFAGKVLSILDVDGVKWIRLDYVEPRYIKLVDVTW